MVLTRSQSKKANTNNNIKLTREDYECATTIMQLQSATNPLQVSPIFRENVKIHGENSGYNLRQQVSSANYSIYDDWDSLSDPTWAPWNFRSMQQNLNLNLNLKN